MQDTLQAYIPNKAVSQVLELLKHDTLKNKLLWFSWTYFINTDFLKANKIL